MNRIIDLRTMSPTTRAVVPRETDSGRGALQSANPRGFAFISPVKDETQYGICRRYLDALDIPSGYSVEKIAVFGGGSMAEVYQRAMEASTARYKIYLHVDGYVIHRGLLSELLNLFSTYPKLGLVGVEGASRLPFRVLYSVNNPFHIYGRIWNYRRPGGPLSLLGSANRRRLHFERFRSFVGDYLPAVTVDGFFMATQYDIPWVHPEFGFDLYETVQSLEFIKAGLEVGIARQDVIWCIHWGPLEEPPHEQHRRRLLRLHRDAAVFRQLYPEFIGASARKLYDQYRRGGRLPRAASGEGDGPVTSQQIMSANFHSADPMRESLGAVVVALGGQRAVRRALRALLPQCETLKNVECQVVVVDNSSADDTVKAVRRESPKVTVIPNPSNGGRARAFNLGLRSVRFPGYVLITQDDTEFSPGSLATMVDYLREHPSTAGVIACRTDSDGMRKPQRTAIVELVPGRPRRTQPITFIETTCALVRGEVFFDVGLYDERFHSRQESFDWSLRAKRKDYSFVFLPEAKVIHHRIEESENRPTSFADLYGNLWLVYKHAGRRWATLLYWMQRLQTGWLALRWRNNGEALRQLAYAVAQLRGIYGRLRAENARPQLLESTRSPGARTDEH